MLVREFTYKDFNNIERKESFCFNLSRADLLEMELGAYGGLDEMMRRLIQEKQPEKIVAMFKNLILTAVGRKSPDGRRFERSQEIRDDFYQTNAYSQLFSELVLNPPKMREWLLQTVEDDVRESILATEAGEHPAEAVMSATGVVPTPPVHPVEGKVISLPGAGGPIADN